MLVLLLNGTATSALAECAVALRYLERRPIEARPPDRIVSVAAP